MRIHRSPLVKQRFSVFLEAAKLPPLILFVSNLSLYLDLVELVQELYLSLEYSSIYCELSMYLRY